MFMMFMKYTLTVMSFYVLMTTLKEKILSRHRGGATGASRPIIFHVRKKKTKNTKKEEEKEKTKKKKEKYGKSWGGGHTYPGHVRLPLLC